MRSLFPALVLRSAVMVACITAVPALAQMPGPGVYQASPYQPMMPGPGVYQASAYQPGPGVYMGQGLGVAPDACAMPGPCAGPSSCAGTPGFCDVPCDQEACRPRWTFSGEAIALQRTATRSQSLFQGVKGGDLLNAQDMDFPVAFGPRVSAIRHGECWDLEVAYFQLDGFTADASVPGSSVIVTDKDPSAVDVTNATARYTSAFYNGELNVRWQRCEWLTFIAGARMVQLNERYRADASGVALPLPVSLEVNSFNHLYGYQIGAEAEVYNMGGPLTINGLCKAGIYRNFASQNASRNYDVYQSLGAQNNHAAFLGEVGLVARYAFTKQFAFRASYEAMWLEGVALAPEQISANDFPSGPSSVNMNGGVFYHGGNLGFEYRF